MLFGKKEKDSKVNDVIWMTETAKWNGIIQEWKKDNHLSLICWFDSTLQHAESLFSRETTSPVSIFLASQVHPTLVTGSKILFAEHYPLYEKEINLFRKLSIQEVTVHSAMDEPLFLRFGGEKIIQLMKQMGMKEDQSVQHKMISGAISKAQDKIARKVISESLSHSPAEWLEKNVRNSL